MKKLIFFSMLLTNFASASYSGYTYQKIITLKSAKVPSTDQNDFPVLISTTDAQLATTGNGGHVQNASGFDIIFSTVSDCSFSLKWDTETYNASTGNIIVWVKVSTVSHTSDTSLYMCYGNSSITTYQGGAIGSAWNSGYTGVWHMNDNAANTTVYDSIASGHNGTFSTNTSNRTITGQIANALDSHAAGDFTDLGNVLNTSWGSGVSFTLQVWCKANSYPASKSGLITKTANAVPGPIFATRGVNLYYEGYDGTNNPNGSGGTSLTTGVWMQVGYTRVTGTTTGTLYLNGASDGTLTDSSGDMGSAGDNLSFGNSTNNGGKFDGQIDEVRISTVARSANWITTEYNNISSLATFYSIGSETTTGVITPSTNSFLIRGGKVSTTGGRVTIR